MQQRNIKIRVCAAFLDAIKDKTDIRTDEEVIEEALSAYNWMVEERAAQREILSTKSDGSDAIRIAMTSLEWAATKARAQPKP